MDLKEQIKELHINFGPCIPFKAFTPELQKLLFDYKEMQTKENWLDDDLIWCLANLDRYNNFVLRERDLSNG